MPSQPSADEPPEKVHVLATARDMADALAYLIGVADKAGLETVARGLMRIRVRLITIGGEPDPRGQYLVPTSPNDRRREKPH